MSPKCVEKALTASVLTLVLLGLCHCARVENSTDGLKIELSVGQSAAKPTDTLSYVITIRNPTLKQFRLRFPNQQQTVLSGYGPSDSLAFEYPTFRQPLVSYLELGPLGSKSYRDSFPLQSFRLIDLVPGQYRLVARLEDYLEPTAVRTLTMTE